ncbi:MAG: hypothetical protein MR902_08020 [Campylobacter sp.]|nr:hypothetical protein [Campylobacter sp.]
MEYITQNFMVSFTITNGAIKTRRNGEFQGIKYDSAVTIKSTNLYESENESTEAIDELEDSVEFILTCKDNLQAGVIKKLFRQLFNQKIPFTFVGNLPRRSDGGVSRVQILMNSDSLKAEIETLINKNKK